MMRSAPPSGLRFKLYERRRREELQAILTGSANCWNVRNSLYGCRRPRPKRLGLHNGSKQMLNWIRDAAALLSLYTSDIDGKMTPYEAWMVVIRLAWLILAAAAIVTYWFRN